MELIRKKLSRLIILLYFLVSIATASLIPSVLADEAEIFDQHRILSHLMVNMFLEIVDQGDIIIFGQSINRSDLRSYNVAFVHDTNNHSNSIKLYFKLKKKILIPGNESFYVGGITVETDQNGSKIAISKEAFPVDIADEK